MKTKFITQKPSFAKKYEIHRQRLMKVLNFRKLILSWGDYDHFPSGMIGELYAESYLGLTRAKKGQSGFDGIIKKKKIQVKTKDGGNDSDTGVYFSIPDKNYKSFDQLLGVRILTKERNAIKSSLQVSHIGPIPKNALRKIETKRKNERRYYLRDLLLLGFTEEIVIKKR